MWQEKEGEGMVRKRVAGSSGYKAAPLDRHIRQQVDGCPLMVVKGRQVETQRASSLDRTT